MDQDKTTTAERASRLDPLVGHALGEAVAAIYFADNSDYLSALWTIVRDLGGDAAVEMLEHDEHAAYARYAAERDPVPNAEVSRGAQAQAKTNDA